MRLPKFERRPIRVHHAPVSGGVVVTCLWPGDPRYDLSDWWYSGLDMSAAAPGREDICARGEIVSVLRWEWAD